MSVPTIPSVPENSPNPSQITLVDEFSQMLNLLRSVFRQELLNSLRSISAADELIRELMLDAQSSEYNTKIVKIGASIIAILDDLKLTLEELRQRPQAEITMLGVITVAEMFINHPYILDKISGFMTRKMSIFPVDREKLKFICSLLPWLKFSYYQINNGNAPENPYPRDTAVYERITTFGILVGNILYNDYYNSHISYKIAIDLGKHKDKPNARYEAIYECMIKISESILKEIKFDATEKPYMEEMSKSRVRNLLNSFVNFVLPVIIQTTYFNVPNNNNKHIKIILDNEIDKIIDVLFTQLSTDRTLIEGISDGTLDLKELENNKIISSAIEASLREIANLMPWVNSVLPKEF